MKNVLADLVKKMEEAKKMIASKGNGGMKKLEEIKNQFSNEIDKYLDGFYKKKNYVQEAIKEKIKLRKSKVGFFRQMYHTNIRFIISIPFIYSIIIPGIILHIFLEFYHRICFPLYGVKALKMRDYFTFDRHHLSYLNPFEKLNCIYCSYINCLLSYARDIAALTELYWCPIKHARQVRGPHKQYHLFVDYLEGDEYRKKIEKLQTIAEKGGIEEHEKEEK